MSTCLQPYGLQHSRLCCPPPSPWVCSNSSPLSWWCYLTHLSICLPFLISPSIFPSIRSSFPMNQLFLSGSQIMGASALASLLPVNIQGWFPLGLTGLTLQSNRLSSVFSSTTIWNHQFLVLSLLYGPTLTSVYDYWEKNKTKHIALIAWTFGGKLCLCHTCTTCQDFDAWKVSRVWNYLFVTIAKVLFHHFNDIL